MELSNLDSTAVNVCAVKKNFESKTTHKLFTVACLMESNRYDNNVTSVLCWGLNIAQSDAIRVLLFLSHNSRYKHVGLSKN